MTKDVVVHGLSAVGKDPVIIYPADGSEHVLVVRTSDAAAALRDLRAAVRRIDGTITATSMTGVEADVARTIAQQRFSTMLLGGFAGLAAGLAAIGLYGVLAHAVAERTREIGIRIALGATPARVGAAVVRNGVVMSAFGLAICLTAATWATHLLRAMLFNVGEHDAGSFTAAALLLLVVAVVACLVPMRRAMSVDPVIAMRDGADRRW